jgi:protein tyrosine phosphatase type 4A
MAIIPPKGFATKPTYLSGDGYRFLIMDAPTDENAQMYLEECKKHHVRVVVRACEPTYGSAVFEKAGISIVELPFPDGEAPPPEVVARWLDLCNKEFSQDDKATVAVHCVAGLGRAPVLVATYLIDRGGMDALQAIEFIRKKRRGAINARQLKFLETWTPPSKKSCCTIL